MEETAPKPSRRPLAIAAVTLVGTVFLACCLAGYDPADPQSGRVYPANELTKNWCGPVGASTAALLVEIFGACSWLLCAAGVSLAIAIFRRRSRSELCWRLFGVMLLLPAAAALGHRGPSLGGLASVIGPGGTIGSMVANGLEGAVSRVGSLVILVPLFFAGLALVFDSLMVVCQRACAGIVRRFADALQRWKSRPKPVEQPVAEKVAEPPIVITTSQPAVASVEITQEVDNEESDGREHPQQELRITRPAFTPPTPQVVAPPPPIPTPSAFLLPDIDILDESEPFEYGDHEAEVRDRARLLEETFANFSMSVKVVQIDTGPVVTQYEIELEPGLRANKVKAMSDDLAIAMRAQNVRIVAPIPGKNTVGIEVPNERRAKVALREVMTSSPNSATTMRLPLYLGKDVKGLPLVCDLANMPHLLIAGRTGTGKSVCLNALIISILMTRTPEQVKMLMIDPKMVELSLYKDIPHLLHPVVTDMQKAEALLAWAVDKMEERYELLARVGVRHIDAFNKLSRGEIIARLKAGPDEDTSIIPEHMPYILIFADEMADLMMTAAKEVEAHIIRLAQKSRAVGIHLILATQKPTVDVITGLIKSNLPARIAFQVASRTDSRVVLDEMGADKLLGNGDMLFLYPGTSKISRAQGTYVSDGEVARVTERLASQARPQFSRELIQLQSAARREGGSLDNLAERDPLYEQAIDVVIREQRGSVSLLQRAMGIGYGRGARLIDYMAEDGIVGEYNGSQAREVMYTMEQWEELRNNRRGKAG